MKDSGHLAILAKNGLNCGSYPNFARGIRKKWSRDDFLNPIFQVFAEPIFTYQITSESKRATIDLTVKIS